MMFVGAGTPLHADGLVAAAEHVEVDPALFWTVVTVETAGCGFLADRRPSILFERHVFSARTNRRFDATHAAISGPPGGYGKPGAHQYVRLEEAIACDHRAALESASWGLGQIMGFNARLAGVRDAEELVLQMVQGENEQLLAMARFMRASEMHLPLQRRDWTGFARRYNGPSFAKNSYHEKLAAAHATLAARGLPDLNARAVQLLLTYHGFDPGKIDGIVGARTRAAIGAFASKHAVTAPEDHKELHSVLLEVLPPAAKEDATAAPAMQAGSAAPDLRLVQSLLEFLECRPGPVDGEPGPQTRRAVAEFQRSRGAAATGQTDAGLIFALVTEAKRRFGSNSTADTRLIQRLLVIRGFDPKIVDGRMGPLTRAAVGAFLRSRGVLPTTVPDARLLDDLLKETA